MNTKAVYFFACSQCGKSFKLANPQPKIVCSCGNQRIEPAEKQDDRPIPCIHRNAELRTLNCNCVGKPKVYQCSLYGECLARDVSHAAAKPYRKCTKCSDRQIYRRGRIGIVHGVFEAIGGTETFCRQLHKLLGDDFVGVATVSEPHGVAQFPVYGGTMAIAALCEAVDVVLCWAIDDQTAEMLKQSGKRIVAVHHSSIESDWNNDAFGRAASFATERVAIDPEVAGAFGCDFMRSPVVPFEIDELPQLPAWFQPAAETKYVLWNHRPVADKGLPLAKQIAAALPAGWQMLISVPRDVALPANAIAIGTDPANTGFLRVANVCLATPKFEGFGYSVVESALAGVPVVSTPAGVAFRSGIARCVHSADVGDWVAAIVTAEHFDRLPLLRQMAYNRFVAPAREWWFPWLANRSKGVMNETQAKST